MTKKHFLVALMLSPLFLAACGGGSNPEPTSDEPLSITCVEGSTTIMCNYSEIGTIEGAPKLKYSTDKIDWKDFSITIINEPAIITTLSKGQTVYFCGDNPNGFNEYTDSTNYKYFQFRFLNNNEVKLKVGGNVMSLLDTKDYANKKEIPCDGCFYNLFGQFGGIGGGSTPTRGNVDASELLLPATKLKKHAYHGMFGAASGTYKSTFSKAPKKLPATEAAEYCYDNMFSRAEFLTTAPEISLNSLAVHACYNMFNGCAALKIYSNEGSEGRTKFFVCPDTSPDGCVGGMFAGTAGEFKEDPTAGNAYYYKA